MDKSSVKIYTIASSESNNGHFALVLEEIIGTRRLPIIIGMAEAQAIALELESIKPSRPMTHDLMVNMCAHFDIDMKEIVITDLREGTFFAHLVLESATGLHEVDCRPSDGIALALRFNTPIYVYESVLNEAGIEKDPDLEPHSESHADMDSEQAEVHNDAPQSHPKRETTPRKKGSQPDSKDLHRRLEEALKNEDYELAAQLRDKISKLQE